ncbi:MAG: ATP-binding protein [Proteobacteria bacterium]|nr:ATP-binding protein [Pseudomonadota bacterium]
MPDSLQLERLLHRAEVVLGRLEACLPPVPPLPDWQSAIAWRWRRSRTCGYLQAIKHPHWITLDDLDCIDEQKARVLANTRQFVARKPANNVLLTGARGSGKSSLVKAMLHKFSGKGLRLIEVDKEDMVDLPDIVDLLAGRQERFIIFCDDLSFAAGESSFKALKSVLDGSLAAAPDNVLIYATSNRRHLMPEYFSENMESQRVGDEIHPGEAMEEKISLSERFGLWISFYPFDQEAYLTIVEHWLKHFGISGHNSENVRREALNWALARGARNGRVAWQFAKDWSAQHHKKK